MCKLYIVRLLLRLLHPATIRSIVVSVSVCLSVSYCNVFPLAYLKKCMTKLHEIFCIYRFTIYMLTVADSAIRYVYFRFC